MCGNLVNLHGPAGVFAVPRGTPAGLQADVAHHAQAFVPLDSAALAQQRRALQETFKTALQAGASRRSICWRIIVC